MIRSTVVMIALIAMMLLAGCDGNVSVADTHMPGDVKPAAGECGWVYEERNGEMVQTGYACMNGG